MHDWVERTKGRWKLAVVWKDVIYRANQRRVIDAGK